MSRVGMGLMLLSLVWAPRAFSCGKEVTQVLTGEKTVDIQLVEDGKIQTIQDDDGMLTVALVAAYCNQSLDLPLVDVPESKLACVEKVQNDAKTKDENRIYSTFDGGGDPNTLRLIKEKCDVDLEAAYRQLKKTQAGESVECGPKVKDIAQRAVVRYNEYMAEIRKDVLPKLDKDKVLDVLLAMTERLQSLQQFAKITANDPMKRGDFNKWLFHFANLTPRESFSVVGTTEPKTLPDILQGATTNFPGIPPLRCGFGISDEAFNKLRQAKWPVSAAQPAETGGENANQ